MARIIGRIYRRSPASYQWKSEMSENASGPAEEPDISHGTIRIMLTYICIL